MDTKEDTGVYPATGDPSGFGGMVGSLVDKYIKVWWELCADPAAMTGETTGFTEKRRRQSATDKFIDSFIDKIESYPSSDESRVRWKSEVKHLSEESLEKIKYIKMQGIGPLFSAGIIESTEAFINKVREFDISLQIEDIWQATRNVWIMNITQILLGRPVKCTPSVFAYSMLYPYTDNYIDDANLDSDSKSDYSSRFEKRLAGERIEPKNNLEAKIFSLVGLIEGEHERLSFPHVYDSLLGIHKSQNKSILQHTKSATPYTSDILGISFEKGGMSVLADAYLVKGELTLAEIDFFFAYGLMLQLCDDLQDIKEDFSNDHHTVFSFMYKKWPIDDVTDALFNLVDYVAELVDELKVDDPAMFKNLIRENCRLMLYFAIAKNKDLYTKRYWDHIRSYIPYTPGYIGSMYKKVSKKFKKLKPSYNGVSTDKIVLEAIR